MHAAWRIVALQPLAAKKLPEALRERVRVIHQSLPRPKRLPQSNQDLFEVCVIGHLREVKDPFRTAEAVRLMPSESRVRVVHVGAALDSAMERRARHETETNERYEWLGSLPRSKAIRVLSRCRLMALTSKMEGGANVISESVVCEVPVLSSRIAGSIGLLGEDYPGYFAVGDTAALALLFQRAERDPSFLDLLRSKCEGLALLFNPEQELAAWAALLEEL